MRAAAAVDTGELMPWPARKFRPCGTGLRITVGACYARSSYPLRPSRATFPRHQLPPGPPRWPAPCRRPGGAMTGSPRSAQDWPAIAYRVAVELLGEPNTRLSSGREWRWGRRGSFALQAETGRWYDFESDTKGGALDLIVRETGLDRPAAFEWLRARGLVDTPDSRIPAAAATNPSRRGCSETAGNRQTVRRNPAEPGGLWPRPLAALPGHPHGHRTPRPPLAGPPQPVAARPSPARRPVLVAGLRPQAHRRGRTGTVFRCPCVPFPQGRGHADAPLPWGKGWAKGE